MRPLPFLAVIVKSIEVNCELISFANSEISYLGVLSEFVETSATCWALESQGFTDNPIQEFEIRCCLKGQVLLQVLEKVITSLALLRCNFGVLVPHLLEALW